MNDIAFVNIHGEPVPLTAVSKRRTPKEQPASFHNGWRVQGIPPGALEEARADHAREALVIRENGEQPKDWNEEHWLMNAKRKAVRPKPYELESAARQCADMATKAGWLRVEVLELKKEERQ